MISPIIKRAISSDISSLSVALIQDEEHFLENLHSTSQLTFRCVCLSNMMDDNSPEKIVFSHFNSLSKVKIENLVRVKCKFRVLEVNDYQDNAISFTNMVPDPLASGMSEADRMIYINAHPTAYTQINALFEKPITYGSIITVKRMGDMNIITEIESYGKPIAGLATNSTLGPSSYF